LKLTDQEKTLIAKRAHGSYAIIPNMRRIVDAHRKNKNPEDAPFLAFARLALKKSYAWDDYERLARAVLAIIPEPYGTPFWKLPPKEDPEDAPLPVPKAKPKRKCGICSERGHNARTCPNKPDTPTVKHTDGIERLSPGFDPNPPDHQNDRDQS